MYHTDTCNPMQTFTETQRKRYQSVIMNPMALTTKPVKRVKQVKQVKPPMSNYEIVDYLRKVIRRRRQLHVIRDVVAFILLVFVFYIVSVIIYSR